jgi:hypothetical protein
VQVESHARVSFLLPFNDATPEALRTYQEANNHFRTVPWPAPFDRPLIAFGLEMPAIYRGYRMHPYI